MLLFTSVIIYQCNILVSRYPEATVPKFWDSDGIADYVFNRKRNYSTHAKDHYPQITRGNEFLLSA